MQQHEGYCVSVWERWCLIKWQSKRWWWGICSERKVHAYLSMKRRAHLNSWGRSLIVYCTLDIWHYSRKQFRTIFTLQCEQDSTLRMWLISKWKIAHLCDHHYGVRCVSMGLSFHITWQVQETSFHVDFQLVSLNVLRKKTY